jgi:hypothetical protein
VEPRRSPLDTADFQADLANVEARSEKKPFQNLRAIPGEQKTL